MSEVRSIAAPESAPEKSTKENPVNLVPISRRRAGRILKSYPNAPKPFALEIWRLRRPNKEGVQMARDLQKELRFETFEKAQAALDYQIANAEDREEKRAAQGK